MADFLVWPWRPQRGMVESLEWLTDITEAHDGTEQRQRIRFAPRQSFDASVLFDNTTELSRLHLALTGWQHRLWGWPCWHEEQKLAATLSAGATSITVDTTASDYRAGGYAIVWSSPSLYEVVDVDAVEAGAITLVEETVGAWPAGASIMPLRVARMSDQSSREDYATKATKTTISMTCTDNEALTTEASATQYLGYDVLTEAFKLTGDTTPRKIDRTIETLDPGPGAWATDARTDYPLVTTDQRWLTRSMAQS